ncbi:DUF6884 domain-containing protein [Nocardiopsis deserti]|uniref:DUF6884 domain-containing protein n=1 Tax=Nocardiopsis deserti TaxID=2605988 RepID=UPI00123A03A5|nr:DUF6884 domain-containing protein [Nocardiopsis deserti]
MPTTKSTTAPEPLAAPVGALVLWEYGPHSAPTAHLTVQVSARGRREAPRRNAVLSLASAYGVRARRTHLEEQRTGKNTTWTYVGDHPTQVDLVGRVDDVTRMVAALPHVLAAIERTATAHVKTFGRWLRHTEAGEYEADAPQIPALLRRWRREFVEALAGRLAIGTALSADPVDPDTPWTYQVHRVAAAHVEAAGWDLAQWQDPAAAAAILDGAVRRDMSTPAEERLPERVTCDIEPERESVWEEASRTRAARIQASTDAALAEYEAAERERQDAPEPRRADEPGVVAPGMYADLVPGHPWRTRARSSMLGGVLVSIGPRASRIHARGRIYSVPNTELTVSTARGPVAVTLDELRTRDVERALDLAEVFGTWTVADHLEHAQRGRRPALVPCPARPAVAEQPPLFAAEPSTPGRTPEETAGPLVVIPCSASKATRPAPARELYTGSYHRMCAAAAEALTARGGRVLILSARHGLIEPAQVLEPYEHRMGQLGTVTAEQLRAQAARLGAADADQVVILAGRAYAQAARAVWPHALTPLAGTRGIGHQRARLAEIIRSSTLPTTTTYEATAA